MANKSLIPQIEKRDPFRGFLSLHSALDRMIDDWFGDGGLAPLKALETEGFQMPSVDVAETDKDIVVSADLPGIDEKNVEVTLHKDCLVIKGEKKEEQEEKKKDYYRRERRFGSIYREIALPCDVETDKANAAFSKGVLKVTLPKTVQAQKESVKIPIKAQ